jgi:hypothetical protein
MVESGPMLVRRTDPRAALANVVGALILFALAWVVEGLVTGEWRSLLVTARSNPRLAIEIGVIVIVAALCVVVIVHPEGSRRWLDVAPLPRFSRSKYPGKPILDCSQRDPIRVDVRHQSWKAGVIQRLR